MHAVRLLCVLLVLSATGTALAAPPALIEIEVGKKPFTGKIAAHNSQAVWLMERDGQLAHFSCSKVEKWRTIAPQFQPWSNSVVRDELRREFGNGYEVVGTRHYLVCARSQAQAKACAEKLEELYRAFHLYFSVRGFQIREPEFPLVAILFPDHNAFAKYSGTVGIKATANLQGYYKHDTNRIALFEGSAANVATLSQAEVPLHDWSASIDGNLQDTLIHEATHQVAFNTGLHSRIGVSPRWVVEGLATVFEAPGIRHANTSAKTRINPERFVWFGNFNKTRRKPQSLDAFVSGDEMFEAPTTLDAYSQAWALTFFLIETRSSQYAKYLALIAQRNPLADYPPPERLADFKKCFGDNTALLDADFVRFIGNIR